MPSTSDFVKKLYKMLEDPLFQSVVSWGPQGDCFVVKDMNEFTKSILPRMFKHSNFASFVRQLNKYDFHKVKNTDDNQFGEHSWTFRHPDFHADRRDALENIKRKVPAQRKAAQAAAQAQAQAQAAVLSALPSLASPPSLLPNNPVHSQSQLQVDQLQLEVHRLREEGDDLRSRIRALERNYESVLVEMVGFQRGMAQQDGLMQNLIAYFLGSESGKLKATNPTSLLNPQSTPSASILPTAPINFPLQSTPPKSQQSALQTQPQTSSPPSTHPNPFVPPIRFFNAISTSGSGSGSGSSGASRGYEPTSVELGRTSLVQMSEISRRMNGWNGGRNPGDAWASGDPSTQQAQTRAQAGPSSNGSGSAITRAEALAKIEEIYRVKMGGHANTRVASAGVSASATANINASASGSQPWSALGQQGQEDPMENYVDGSQQLQSQQAGPSNSLWSGLDLGGMAEDPSAKAMLHEGLQVYTVGHLMPRSMTAEMNTNDSWNFDGAGSNVNAGSMPSQSRTQNQQRFNEAGEVLESRPGNQRDGDTPEEEDEEERVMPSPMVEYSSKPSQSTSPSTSSGGKPSNSGITFPTKGSSVSISTETKGKGNKLRVRRSTFVPGWTVPPRVLLVDDDIVSRKLGSKFLQVFGCTIDVAVDGVGAVNKMNLEKYDLVLMDIVMPKLDGITATSLIRQFDHLTPIISMTSNSKPNEIMTYYSSGMNDILPKPFTQSGLFEMLEKHLMHLKTIQSMSKVPRSIGIPPLSDSQFEQAVTAGAAPFAARTQNHLSSSSSSQPSTSSPQSNTASSPTTAAPPTAAPYSGGPYGSYNGYGDQSSQNQGADDDSRINPLSGMGLTDEQYNMILQNIANGESFMNGMVDSAGASSSASASTGPSAGPSGSSTQPKIGSGISNGTMGMMGVSSMGVGVGMGVGMSRAGEKRGYEEAGLSSSGGRDKRSRFEVVE
ncbi:hypothetical protein P691DRAFT_775528 [Macrolepiota fuliginosa MF-IS2]|uniref:Response regulatory domain-containing protein n=1 Tax=Macrolepiota fuliginosa MF-IS2 TaxID=1400762 RepID=A0A9P5XDU8_9AGAR|nr:hypothetical protein P691DRAFT_775528 [Macrolepiota fuliginosa MF-IS2]